MNTVPLSVVLVAFVSACMATADAAPLRISLLSSSEPLSLILASAEGLEVITDTETADVLLVQGTNVNQSLINAAAKRGSGIVMLGSRTLESASGWKEISGGSWTENSRRFPGVMMLYPLTDADPVTKDMSAFDLRDETAYDLDLDPKIHVLASAFTPKVTADRKDERAPERLDRANVYDLQPQVWAYESPDGHRAFVLLQDDAESLAHPSVRRLILRGTAWAGRLENVDSFSPGEDPGGLRYPPDGPRRAEETVKSFDLSPGFTASVIASEPLINKPIAMQWDARGRLWIAETPEYPNGRRPMSGEPWQETGVLSPGNYGRPATDRVSILEDTDGDGRMDKKTVFCSGLELVTGFCLYRDGIIAVHQPDIVFIHNEGENQKVERLFAGFSPGDTHFVANHFTVGMDGWIYANTGSGADAVSVTRPDVRAKISSGVFRFKPDGSAIQQVGSKGGNAFGLDLTSDGEVFAGQATSGNPLQHVVLPEWVLSKGKSGSAGSMESVISQRKVVRRDLPSRVPYMQIDMVGGYSSACASAVQEGGAWPDVWKGTIFCTEPILDIIHCERLVPDGPTFTGDMFVKNREWLRADDFRFFPVDVDFGPDGAMYVLDFYNPIVAHGDSRGPKRSTSGASVRPDREHYFGRIYRIQHKEAKPLMLPNLANARTKDLPTSFRHPNKRVRLTAQQQLLERADAVRALPELKAMAISEAFTPGRILALWTLHQLGGTSTATLRTAMESPDPGIRKTALLIVESEGSQAQADVSALLGDSDARVRLLALRAMASTPLTTSSSANLLAALPALRDDWSRSAAAAAASSNAAPVLLAALASPEAPGSALLDLAQSLTNVVTDSGDSAVLAEIVAACAQAGPASHPLVLTILETAGRKIPPLPDPGHDGPGASLTTLLNSADCSIQSAVLPIAAAWGKVPGVEKEVAKRVGILLALASDKAQPDALRAAAVTGLVRARQADSAIGPGILALLKTSPSDVLAVAAITALAGTGDDALGVPLVDALPALTPAAQNTLYNLLLSRTSWSNELVNALESRQLPITLLGPARLSRLRQHPDAPVRARAIAVIDALGGGSNPEKDQVIARLQPEIESKPGDPARGKLIFNAACGTCHKINGVGQDVGPVLDGIGVHGTHELLVHILDPGRAVDNEHRTWSLTLKNGTFLTGIIARENERSLTLKLPGGIQQDVKTADIQSRLDTGLSMMPEGLEGLGADSLRDILAFLSEGSGKYRALPLDRAFTTDTGGGLYASRAAKDDTVQPKRYGVHMVEGVPFSLPDPSTTRSGGNVIVLKSDVSGSFASTLPQRVEIPVGFSAGNLHFLGGVAGWGGGPESHRPAMRITIEHEDGTTQTEELQTGEVFLDYVSSAEVPGSKRVDGLTTRAHVRYFSIPVHDRSPIRKLILESHVNGIAPTTLAITTDSDFPKASPGRKASGNIK